ncbi:MAG: cytochrome b [Hyphomicrobium sp.]
MIRNTQDAWGWPAIALHWLVALLVISTFGLGLWMGEVPARVDRPYYYAIHASLGITLFAILLLRIVWALLNPVPAAPPGTSHLQHTAARFTHLTLYVLTLATVSFGWLLAGLQDTPIEPLAFGIVPVPSPLPLSHAAEDFLEEAHEIAAYLLIAVAGLHVVAALWHHYVLRDNILRRMLGSGAQPVA